MMMMMMMKFMKVLLVMKAMISGTHMRRFPFNIVAMNCKPVDEKQETTG